MRKASIALLTALMVIWAGFAAPPSRAQQQAESFVAGRRIAAQYAYGFGSVPGAHVAIGNSATGSQTVTVCPAVRALADGRVVNLFQNGILNPVTFDLGTASSETVTPTAVSIVSPGGLTVEADQNCAAITGSFSFTHAPSQFNGQVRSGTFGLQEAINDAAPVGGLVVVDNTWQGTNANLSAAIPYANVALEDTRGGIPQYWYPTPGNTTFLAVPATLTATTVGFGLNGANTTGGSYTGGSTYHVCVAYVDIMGNEGPCSLDFSGLTAGSGSTNQIGFAAPAASAGAIGYTIYISLAGGTYALAYQVPLTSAVCKLTTLESTTPACALTNTTYNQTGSAAIVSALTVNTAPVALQLGAASTTSDYVGNSGSRTSYLYAPSNKQGIPGTVANYGPFTITTAAATTVPAVLGTIPIPPGFMNFAGRGLRICGKATQATAGSTSTIETIEFLWDAAGSNTTGAPVIIGNGINSTATLVTANADSYTFCGVLRTTVTGAGVTAGTLQATEGWSAISYATTATVAGVGTDTSVGGTASLNLAGTGGNTQRIHVVYVHTGGTDANGLILQNLTVEAL